MESDSDGLQTLLTNNLIDINQKSASGQTPLHLAAKMGMHTLPIYGSNVSRTGILLCVLLVFGADPSIPDSSGKTASVIARDSAYIATAKVLESSQDQYQHIRELLMKPMSTVVTMRAKHTGHFILKAVQSFHSPNLQEYPGSFEWDGLQVSNVRAAFVILILCRM